MFTEEIDNFAEYNTKLEFERQVYRRMTANGLTIRLMRKYGIHPVAKELIDKELSKASSELPAKTRFPMEREERESPKEEADTKS